MQNKEREHKYLVRTDEWRQLASEGDRIQQGYVSSDPETSVRVRVTADHAELGIKKQNGAEAGRALTRSEYEFPIAKADGMALLESVCEKPIIEKTRYRIQQDGLTWEVDEFDGANRGLVLAEVEVDSDVPPSTPGWVGEEVSDDHRFQNSYLATVPFGEWTGARDHAEPQFHFKQHESIREASVRIIAGELDSALEQLSDRNARSTETAVHEARKSVKKVRALLRMLQPELGKAFRTSNDKLRRAGQKLSLLRDSHALAKTLADLVSESAAEIGDRNYDRLREAITMASVDADTAMGEREWEEIDAALRSVRSEAEAWSLPDHSRFSAIAGGIGRAFRRGRRAFAKARAKPCPENFHAWRKRVKDHWYHMRLVRKCWPEVLDGYILALDQLEDTLGNDHNLALLDEFICTHPESFTSIEDRDFLLTIIRSRQEALRAQARHIGRRIYAERTRHMVRRVRTSWGAWQAES